MSPTFVSDKFLIPVIINPISPDFSRLISFGFGVNVPTFSTIYSSLFDIIFIFIFFLIWPSITLTNITTPKYESYQLSTSKHFRSLFSCPFGGGNFSTICSRILSIPSPVLPEQETALLVSIPITSSI